MGGISLAGTQEVSEGSQVLMLEEGHSFFVERGKFASGPDICL